MKGSEDDIGLIITKLNQEGYGNLRFAGAEISNLSPAVVNNNNNNDLLDEKLNSLKNDILTAFKTKRQLD